MLYIEFVIIFMTGFFYFISAYGSGPRNEWSCRRRWYWEVSNQWKKALGTKVYLSIHIILSTLNSHCAIFLNFSPHPYIFFNKDRVSITFVGFTVTKQGDLINPVNQQVMERAIMTPQLYTGLQHNRVNFQDDYRVWKKPVMIEKISTVMGVEFPYDPDESYVLTVDNIIKILAIQMRFRSKNNRICFNV